MPRGLLTAALVFLALAPAAPLLGQDQEPARSELVLPDSIESALAMRLELSQLLVGRTLEELKELQAAWMTLLALQQKALDAAKAAPDGSPEREQAVALRADLDTLVAAADSIVAALSQAGGDAERAMAEIDAFRTDVAAELEESTVPKTREAALELPVEVLKARLRPLTRAQVEEQLAQWIAFLQQACLEVSNAEASALTSTDLARVEDFNAAAVEKRAVRGRLIERVNVVIDALDKKAGDVTEARAYVGSIVVTPPITGLRVAWSTTVAWLRNEQGGIATAKKAAVAIGVLVGFWLLAKVLTRFVGRAVRSLPRTSALLRDFIQSSVRRLTIIIGVLVALSTLGINMTPLVAAIGAAGLVIGLALQGTLGNLASGLMIMIYRPFDTGDIISTAGSLGTVDGMTLMTTAIKTFDNQTIHVPNNMIWGDVITNITANPTRRVDLKFGISYGDDIRKAREVLERIVAGHEKVLADPEPVIRLHELGDSSVNFIVRPWCRTSDYWDVYWDLTAKVKETFDEEGISIPFPQRDVHLIPANAPGVTGAPGEPGAPGAPGEPDGQVIQPPSREAKATHASGKKG